MANPRKFSEKIALHNQKQAEETAAFEQIMREVMGATRVSVRCHSCCAVRRLCGAPQQNGRWSLTVRPRRKHRGRPFSVALDIDQRPCVL